MNCGKIPIRDLCPPFLPFPYQWVPQGFWVPSKHCWDLQLNKSRIPLNEIAFPGLRGHPCCNGHCCLFHPSGSGPGAFSIPVIPTPLSSWRRKLQGSISLLATKIQCALISKSWLRVIQRQGPGIHRLFDYVGHISPFLPLICFCSWERSLWSFYSLQIASPMVLVCCKAGHSRQSTLDLIPDHGRCFAHIVLL